MNNKNIDKKIRLLFIGFIVAMLCAVGFSIFTFVSSMNSSNEETTEESNPYAEKNEKNEVTYTEGSGGEYAQDKSIALYNSVIEKAQYGDFSGIMDEVGEVRQQYKLTQDYNQTLIYAYMDANVVKNIQNTEIVAEEVSLYSGMNDIKMKSIGFFWLSNKAKATVTIKNDSICPEAKKSVRFEDYEEISLTENTSDITIQGMIDSLSKPGYYLYSVKDKIEHKAYVCYLTIDDIPITMYLVPRLDNTWLVYEVTYRNDGTINENWNTMKYYYSKSDFAENMTITETEAISDPEPQETESELETEAEE